MRNSLNYCKLWVTLHSQPLITESVTCAHQLQLDLFRKRHTEKNQFQKDAGPISQCNPTQDYWEERSIKFNRDYSLANVHRIMA